MCIEIISEFNKTQLFFMYIKCCINLLLKNVCFALFVFIGVPEIGIPPFDPFYATEVKQSRGAGLLGYKLIIYNVTESGWSQSEIRKFK